MVKRFDKKIQTALDKSKKLKAQAKKVQEAYIKGAGKNDPVNRLTMAQAKMLNTEAKAAKERANYLRMIKNL